MPRVYIADTPVDVLTRKRVLQECRSFLGSGSPHHIVTVNPEFVVEAQKNAAFRHALQKSDLALADGFGIILAARWLCGVKLERIPGVDFMMDLCALAEEKGASVFLLGGRGGVAQKTAEILQKKFPKLNVSGWSEDPLEISNYQNIDILFVAFGAPKQELWIAKNQPKLLGVKIAMGVGGAFDMISGKRKRAPQFLRRLGLEWLWRLAWEPPRIWRIFSATFRFVAVALLHDIAA